MLSLYVWVFMVQGKPKPTSAKTVVKYMYGISAEILSLRNQTTRMQSTDMIIKSQTFATFEYCCDDDFGQRCHVCTKQVAPNWAAIFWRPLRVRISQIVKMG